MTSSVASQYRWRGVQLFIYLVTVLAVNGAIPFVTMPTMGQAVWSLGFSQSFANQSIFAIHAINFGQPHPAAIAFGLSGAYPASLLIRFGLQPADAYTLVVATWLIVAFCGARCIAKRNALTETASSLCAVMWLSLPMVWMHVGYSMLALGMALLPWYFLSLLRLIDESHRSFSWRSALRFLIIAVIAVFMDGYTFVMYAVASALYLGMRWLNTPHMRKMLAVYCAPVVITSLASAYILYAIYVGQAEFQADPIGKFRAWGVDIGFIVLPTSGIQWLPDLLHFETKRLGAENFGDVSIWNTSFSLPIICFATITWVRLRKQSNVASTFMIIALAGGFMALGPSLKAFSTRNAEVLAESNPASMPASSTLFSTGNAWISLNIPGFRNMRASYRWLALAEFGCWLLVLLAFRQPTSRKNKLLLYVSGSLIVALNLPHTLERLHDAHMYRTLFMSMNADVEKDLEKAIPVHSRVAFLPWGNDFLVNYLAARANIRALNIGGDKNLAAAMVYWPAGMNAYTALTVDQGFTRRLVLQLREHEIDVAVIPYFDTLWGAHFWPCVSLIRESASSYVKSESRDIVSACPDGIRHKMAANVQALRSTPGISVEDHAYFAVVKLVSQNSSAPRFNSIAYPLTFGFQNPISQNLLGSGWFPPEKGHVWSGEKASLYIPLTAPCQRQSCTVTLVFNTLAASQKRPIELHILDQRNRNELICMASRGSATLRAQATVKGREADILLVVPQANSPAQLGLSPDPRVLGIALLQIDVKPGTALRGDASCDAAAGGDGDGDGDGA